MTGPGLGCGEPACATHLLARLARGSGMVLSMLVKAGQVGMVEEMPSQ